MADAQDINGNRKVIFIWDELVEINFNDRWSCFSEKMLRDRIQNGSIRRLPKGTQLTIEQD